MCLCDVLKIQKRKKGESPRLVLIFVVVLITAHVNQNRSRSHQCQANPMDLKISSLPIQSNPMGSPVVPCYIADKSSVKRSKDLVGVSEARTCDLETTQPIAKRQTKPTAVRHPSASIHSQSFIHSFGQSGSA